MNKDQVTLKRTPKFKNVLKEIKRTQNISKRTEGNLERKPSEI